MSAKRDRFSVVATMLVDGHETIVGEARYAFDSDTASIEFGLSIDDRWQGHGIGKALLKNLECRAASFGAERMFGDTLRSNDAMIALARKSGYAFANTPGDWKLVRFQKADPRRTARNSLRQLAACRRLSQRNVLACGLTTLSPVLAIQNRAFFLRLRRLLGKVGRGRQRPPFRQFPCNEGVFRLDPLHRVAAQRQPQRRILGIDQCDEGARQLARIAALAVVDVGGMARVLPTLSL